MGIGGTTGGTLRDSGAQSVGYRGGGGHGEEEEEKEEKGEVDEE